MEPAFQLAQLNTGRLRLPLDDPGMRDFVASLDRISRLAEASPGFVWRFVAADGHVSHFADDDQSYVNLSVWESYQQLHTFTYRSVHDSLLRARRRWFERIDGPTTVLSWVPSGHRPTLEQLTDLVEFLRAQGMLLDVWTLNAQTPGWRERLARALAAGVDVITTDTPRELARGARES